MSMPGYSDRLRLVLESLAKNRVSVTAVVLTSPVITFNRMIKTLWQRMKRYGLSFIFDDLLPSRLYQFKSILKQPHHLRIRQKNFKSSLNAWPKLKNILITTQVFPPEIHPSAVMVQELAKDLSERGLQVTVAAGFPHHPYGRLYPKYQMKWLRIENEDSFRVVRGWHLINPSSALIPRALVMASQCVAYLLTVIPSQRPNVVISYGPPLIGSLISAMIARICGAKLITLVYDIYPDILVETGYLQNSVLITALHKLESLIYRFSDRVVVLSNGFRRTLIRDKGVPEDKVMVIPVWLDGRDITPMDRLTPWRREMGIGPEKFVVLYAGTVGMVSGAEVVVDSARSLHTYSDILFLFVGAGHAKDRVESLARQAGLRNIKFLPFQPRERLSEVQATADVSLVTLAPGRGRTSVPSKVLGYMAASRPVIASVDDDCDTAEVIRQSKCGLIVPPGDGRALADAIRTFYQRPQALQEAGGAGRAFFLQHYERQTIIRKYIDLIREAVS